MPPVTVSQMLTDIGYAVDDPNQQRFTVPQLLRYINEAQQDVSRRAEVNEQILTMPVFGAVRDYIAPGDTVRIYKVEYNQTGQSQIWPLEHVGLVEMDAVWGVNQFNASATPKVFTTFLAPPNLLLRLFPVPGIAGNLTVYYYRLAHTVAAADNIDLPAGWEDLVRDYAEYLCKRADHDTDWQNAKKIYEDKLAEYIDKSRRFVDAPGQVSTGFDPYPWMSFGDL